MAKWLSETRAKARNPQKTKAWAMPGSGRCLMTLAWQRTSQKKAQARLPRGARVLAGSFFACQMLRAMGRKRTANIAADAMVSSARIAISAVEKCSGSANVQVLCDISPFPHGRSFPSINAIIAACSSTLVELATIAECRDKSFNAKGAKGAKFRGGRRGWLESAGFQEHRAMSRERRGMRYAAVRRRLVSQSETASRSSPSAVVRTT